MKRSKQRHFCSNLNPKHFFDCVAFGVNTIEAYGERLRCSSNNVPYRCALSEILVRASPGLTGKRDLAMVGTLSRSAVDIDFIVNCCSQHGRMSIVEDCHRVS